MRFPTRRAAARTTATYAAIVGDRWLWIALAAPAPVTLHAASGEVTVPVEVDDSQPGHHGVRLDLAALPAPEAEETFAVRSGGALAGPPPAPHGPGTTHALTRDADGHLHVVRRPVPTGARVRALRLAGATVEIDLEGTDDALVLVDASGRAVVTRPVDAGTVRLDPDHLAGAEPGELRALVGGRPVRRRANGLADPGSGAILPALHSPGESEPRGRLRWSADASLVVRVHERPVR